MNLHASHRLSDYPVLEAAARKKTTTIILDGRAIRGAIYEHLTPEEIASMDPKERAFYGEIMSA